ncbi:HEAT repeat domain-containing protein [Nostoc sp. NZL]|uniref:HEAT repeat domain-containing protein n=1 Tax=Nostoc sp. NZL TaxID=2650612 RepID=UPI002ED88818
MLPFLESKNPELREAAVTTLRYINQLEKCPQALNLIFDEEVSVRRAATLTLEHLQDAEVITILCQALTNDSDWQVRRNAAKSLAIHENRQAISALEIALNDEHWQVRKSTAQALQKIPDIQVIPRLIQALTDEYADVRKEAAIALGNLAHPDVINPLQQALDDPDKEVSIQAQRAIEKIQTDKKVVLG